MRRSRLQFTEFLVVVLSVLAFSVTLAAPPKPAGKGKVDHKALQQQPIQLGTSGGSVIDLANGYCCSGTLGALVQIGRVQYILSNTHVFAGDSVAGGNAVSAAEGDDINHPGFVDTSCGRNTNFVVADLVHWCPLVEGGVSPVDAAIAEVRAGMVNPDGAILEIGPLSSDIVAAFPGQAVKKSGRTTGLSRSAVDSINVTISVGYSTECAGTSYTSSFTGQILVRNRGSKFLNSGDSGSVMVEDVAATPRAVGLLFAGSNSIAVANPIGDVLTYFGATMVGQPGAGTATEVSPDTVPPGQLMRAMRLQQVNEKALLKVPGAIGHGIGVGNGRAVIKVFVEELTPEALADAPREIEDVPVVVEAIGKVVAY